MRSTQKNRSNRVKSRPIVDDSFTQTPRSKLLSLPSASSLTTKGRSVHYFPPSQPSRQIVYRGNNRPSKGTKGEVAARRTLGTYLPPSPCSPMGVGPLNLGTPSAKSFTTASSHTARRPRSRATRGDAVEEMDSYGRLRHPPQRGPGQYGNDEENQRRAFISQDYNNSMATRGPPRPSRRQHGSGSDVSSTDASYSGSDSYDGMEFDPIVIPNRYKFEDFALEQKPQQKRMQRMQFWKDPDGLRDEIEPIRGIDSDLELYGGINLEVYTREVQRPNIDFTKKVLEERGVLDPTEELMKFHTVDGSDDEPIVPRPRGDGDRNATRTAASRPTRQQTQADGTAWSQHVSGYGDSPDDASTDTDLLPPSQRILREAKETLKTSKKPSSIALPSGSDHEPAQGNRRSQLPTPNLPHMTDLDADVIPKPSESKPKSLSFSMRDAYETQNFIINRIKSDTKFRTTLRDAFKHYTKEMDVLSALNGCRYLVATELYMFLQGLLHTGVQIDFQGLRRRKSSMLSRIQGPDGMSSQDIAAVNAQYRTLFLQYAIADPTGELKQMIEREWVELIHCVTDLNPDIIKHATIDRDTAYDMLRDLYDFINSEQYVIDCENQMNVMLKQFTDEKKQTWDPQQHADWRKQRIHYLKQLEALYQKEENFEELEKALKERKDLQYALDRDLLTYEDTDDEIVNHVVKTIDMRKLTSYVQAGLLYYYKSELYREYGFEDDIGVILMTKALNCIADEEVAYLLDDITETSNRIFLLDLRPEDSSSSEDQLSRYNM